MRDMKAENLSTRNHTIQLLGLFAAFIALIASAIGSFKAAESVHEFIIIFFSFTFCVVVFSSLISFMGRRSFITGKKENNDKPEEYKTWWGAFVKWFKSPEHWDWLIPFLLSFVLLVVIVVMLVIYGLGDNKGNNSTNNTQPVAVSKYQAKSDSLNKPIVSFQAVNITSTVDTDATDNDTLDFDVLNDVDPQDSIISQKKTIK